MKPVLFVLLGMLLMTACRKDGAATISYDGTWQLTKVSGEITINYPQGDSNLLKFNGNNYSQYTNGVLVKSGTFAIVYDATVQTFTCHIFPAGQFANRIVFGGDYSSPKVFSQINGNTLTLVSGCFADDGGSFSYYTKK